MTVLTKIEICPFVQDPVDTCYCYNLTSRHVNSAIHYCGNHYIDCEIYKKRISGKDKPSGKRSGHGIMS